MAYGTITIIMLIMIIYNKIQLVYKPRWQTHAIRTRQCCHSYINIRIWYTYIYLYVILYMTRDSNSSYFRNYAALGKILKQTNIWTAICDKESYTKEMNKIHTEKKNLIFHKYMDIYKYIEHDLFCVCHLISIYIVQAFI